MGSDSVTDDSAEVDEATRAYAAKKYDDALRVASRLASRNIQVGHYICALIYELGIASAGQDLSRAFRHFEFLAKGFDDEEGYLGCARVILREDDAEKASVAASFCRRAIELSQSQFGYLVLGDVLNHLATPRDPRGARTAYFQAAIRGAAWGWRNLANLEYSQRDWLGSFVLHVWATLVFPLYFLFGGSRALRRG